MSLRSPNLRGALLALLAVALLPIVGAMIYATWHAWRESIDRNAGEIREEATDAARRLSTSIEEARRVLQRLAHEPSIIAGDVDSCERLTADFQQLHPS